jgi:hypothetical protein
MDPEDYLRKILAQRAITLVIIQILLERMNRLVDQIEKSFKDQAAINQLHSPPCCNTCMECNRDSITQD